MSGTSRRYLSFCILTLAVVFAAQAAWSGPPEAKVNGTLTEIEGIPVLRVWGTPQERGFAHGFLLAERIVSMVDGYLKAGPLGGTLERYEKQMLPKLKRIKLDPEHETELRALLAGVEARLGGPAQVPFLGRPLSVKDLVAVNCTGDLVRSGCSSFAAWGKMTGDGQTLAGRNMDWPIVPALLDTQIVLVSVPSADGGRLGWVSVTWPSYVGCITGMNAEGVTVATHDADGRQSSKAGAFTPQGWTFRKALESARASTAVDDIARVIRENPSIVGNNMMVTMPYTGSGPGAIAFEFDADVSEGKGLTIREPEPDVPFLVCTNHFRKRMNPTPCVRFPKLTRVLETTARSAGEDYITLKDSWEMLGAVSMQDSVTYHSVVFEPNKRVMHVAFTEGGKKAPACTKVTMDVGKLLAGDYPGGK